MRLPPTLPCRTYARSPHAWWLTSLAMLVCAAAQLLGGVSDARAEQATLATVSRRVQIFYYPWYGNPLVDGAWTHWQQNGHTPPSNAATNFRPILGLYSSRDRAVIDQHMTWIAQAGIGVVITSWWGHDSAEDRVVPALLDSAAAHGLQVAFHIEPYPGRTAASVARDIADLTRRYGNHSAFFRVDVATDPARSGSGVFYIYDSLSIPADDWRVNLDALRNSGVDFVALAQTSDVGQLERGHFDGLYTYDVLRINGDFFSGLAADVARRGALFAPSVGPGYDDQRAVAGSHNLKARNNGDTYNAMWNAALNSGAPWITITSFNEWHEGTQIEPAVAADGYLDYGSAGSNLYLNRTAWNVLRISGDSGAAN